MISISKKTLRNLARIGILLAAGSLSACSSGPAEDASAGGEIASKSATEANDLGAAGNIEQRTAEVEAPAPGNIEQIPAEGEAPAADTPASGTPSGTAAGTKPGVAPPVAVTPSGTINSLDVVVADMRELNAGALLKVNPKYGFSRGPGYVIQGNDPRGYNTPAWFQSSYPYLINGNYWNYILPWMVVFEGVGNASTNSRVHFRNMKVYVKAKSTGTWTIASQAQTTGGSYCGQDSNYFACAHADGARQESEGGVSFDTRAGMNFHGFFGGFAKLNGPDIAAVLVTLQSRLVRNSSSVADDRGVAKFLLHVGADYYREAASASTVGPGVGNSRAKYITNQWQAFNMMTFSNVGVQEPGGGITEAQFRANPPPLE